MQLMNRNTHITCHILLHHKGGTENLLSLSQITQIDLIVTLNYWQNVHNYSNIAAIITDINVSHKFKTIPLKLQPLKRSWNRKICVQPPWGKKYTSYHLRVNHFLKLANREVTLLERTIGWYLGILYVQKQHIYAAFDAEPFIISPQYVPGTTLCYL